MRVFTNSIHRTLQAKNLRILHLAPLHNLIPSLTSHCQFGFDDELDSSSCPVDQPKQVRKHAVVWSLPQLICSHTPTIKLGLEDDLFHNNNLLSFYVKRCRITEARKLFDEMPIRDVVSWTSIISAYTHSGDDVQALQLFRKMLQLGLMANEFTFSTILRSASSLGNFYFGTCVHAQIEKCWFKDNVVLGSALIDFYSKCDEFAEASRIFAAMDHKDIVSWTTMISACVRMEVWSKAMQLYASMIKSRILPNEFTYTKLLRMCTFLGLHCGRLIHAHIICFGVRLNLVLKTALVDMYSKSNSMIDALKVFKLTSESDVTLWTALITGYSQAGDFEEAITMFQYMEIVGISPNSFTFAKLLNICSNVPVPVLGKQIHSQVIKVGMEHDLSVGNALMDLYAKWSPKFEELVCAFNEIASPNVVSWTCLIAGLVQQECERETFVVFVEMLLVGVRPNSFTLSTILKGCKSPHFLLHVEKLHAYILKTKLDALDMAVGNSLLDAYLRFGKANTAVRLCNAMPARDVFTYTTLAKGLTQMGNHRMALNLISSMHKEGVTMDGFSIACFLSASAGLAAVELGKQLHSYSVKSGLHGYISVPNGLVDMYGKCGSIDEARRAFSDISEPNVVSWNGLISALASNGDFHGALFTFEDMRLAGACPDEVTFLLVLHACSHGGLVDMGIEYFNSMGEFYGVVPQPDHYVCLVDMLGRAGRLEAAACAIETMPFEPDALIYKTLLGGCKLHKNLIMGECMARQAMELDPMDPAIYVLLAIMYEDAGMMEMGEQTRRMMRERNNNKHPGQSWMIHN